MELNRRHVWAAILLSCLVFWAILIANVSAVA